MLNYTIRPLYTLKRKCRQGNYRSKNGEAIQELCTNVWKCSLYRGVLILFLLLIQNQLFSLLLFSVKYFQVLNLCEKIRVYAYKLNLILFGKPFILLFILEYVIIFHDIPCKINIYFILNSQKLSLTHLEVLLLLSVLLN